MQAVPLGFFLFLAQFAAGVMIVTMLLDWDGEVSAGYLFLNGIFALLAIGAGLWLRWILPAERLMTDATANPWLRAEPAVWAAFAVLAGAHLLCLRAERRQLGRGLGLVGSLVAVGALGTSSLAYGSHTFGVVGAAVGLSTGAAALGTVWSGMMLGHWYLVTPLLKPRPLLRLAGALTLVLVAQAAWAAVPLVGGVPLLGGPGAEPFLAALYWLRVGAGILFPLALMFPIWRTARVRSMMSATGLLYIALGLVLAGEIIARVLHVTTGFVV
jgi:hypothetical protein